MPPKYEIGEILSNGKFYLKIKKVIQYHKINPIYEAYYSHNRSFNPCGLTTTSEWTLDSKYTRENDTNIEWE